MTFNYEQAIDTAKRMITRFGTSATLTRQEQTGPDHDPQLVNVDYAVTAIEMQFNDYQRSGTRIQAGDVMFYLSVEDLEIVPSQNDKFTFGDNTYEIIEVDRLAPANTVVYYWLQGRK